MWLLLIITVHFRPPILSVHIFSKVLEAEEFKVWIKSKWAKLKYALYLHSQITTTLKLLSNLCILNLKCLGYWCWTDSAMFTALLGKVNILEAVFMLGCNAAIAGVEKVTVTASVERFPLLKYQLGGDGIFHRYACKEVTSMSTAVSGKLCTALKFPSALAYQEIWTRWSCLCERALSR